jgi:hypothetical protein
MLKVGMHSFSNLFGDGNRSRRKLFIVEIRSCNRYVHGGNPFYSLKMFNERNRSYLEFCSSCKSVHVTNLGKPIHL